MKQRQRKVSLAYSGGFLDVLQQSIPRRRHEWHVAEVYPAEYIKVHEHKVNKPKDKKCINDQKRDV
ncbi:MAG: hypothetical protein AXW12_02390 [Thalassospira sp. Nap_22]|nr:MAG: hypothetical protein AXW12_02390 [Thalassospira sp. Nap_22]